MKKKHKYKTNSSVFIALSRNKTIEGIIKRRMHIGNTPYYRFCFGSQTIDYPEYRLGSTEEEALNNSESFDASLFN